MVDIKQLIKNIEPEVINLRRDFHMYPELGFELERTAGIVADKLTNLGYEVRTGIAKTGVVGILKGSQKGPTVAIRADMDALPIKEDTGVGYASKYEGKMHACGHDGHTAILLGVAEVLANMKDDIQGCIMLIFQPAEEGPGKGGSKAMIDEGVFDDPRPDAILGLHIWPDIDAGKIGIQPGSLFASIDDIDIVVKGESSHGASPHQGVDAVVVASDTVKALQTVVSREVNPTEPAVITLGKIEGGYNRNIIADEVSLQGTIRCVTLETRDNIEKNVKRIVKGIADTYGAKYELDYRHEIPALINRPEYTEIVKQEAIGIIGEDNVLNVDKPVLGGEDFANFLNEVPGTFFLLGGRNIEKGIDAPNHNPKFNFDESVMSIGVEILVKSTLNILKRGI